MSVNCAPLNWSNVVLSIGADVDKRNWDAFNDYLSTLRDANLTCLIPTKCQESSFSLILFNRIRTFVKESALVDIGGLLLGGSVSVTSEF